MRARDLLELVSLAALWGASFMFMRISVPDFGPLATIMLRVAIASALLLPWLALRGRMADLRLHAGPLAVVGLANSALPFALFAYAIVSLGAGLASVLNATAPLFGALIARAWLKERLGALRWMGLALGFVGVVLLARERITPADASNAIEGRALLAVCACLAAALCYGFAANYTRRALAGVDAAAVAAGSQCVATIALLPPAALTWPARIPSPGAWASVVALGALCTGLGYLLYFRLIRNVGPSRAISVTFLIPVFGVLFGTVLLDEPLSPSMLAGSLVVLLGTALATGLFRVPGKSHRSHGAG